MSAPHGSTTGRPIMQLLDLMGRRWALRVMWELYQQPGLSFRALQERCETISPSVLNTRLAELRGARIVELSDGYALTAAGRELACRLMPLHYWAEEHFKDTPES
ncbi:winged helix-turn-helix transcriptional regulator [Niveispirillum sp. KHB5.9]|uniref:winged helix-turn-helix transcriptional regulator n=1 Tax=Niveispirillum sp. KHB5.9 TaxID=3400269 RepID=UPI003A846F51